MVLSSNDEVLSGGGPTSDYETYALGYQPTTKTVSDVAVQIRRQFGDESGVQLTDTDVLRWVNLAQDTIVNRNRVLKARSRTYSTVGQAEYEMPGLAIVQVESLHYNGHVLKSLTFAQAEQQGLSEDAAGEPCYWTEWGGVFRLWPSPKTPQKMDLYYSTRADPVTDLSSLLSVPDKYFPAVVTYCLQQAYEMDEDAQVSQQKAQSFDDQVRDFGTEERTQQHMTYSTITMVDDGW